MSQQTNFHESLIHQDSRQEHGFHGLVQSTLRGISNGQNSYPSLLFPHLFTMFLDIVAQNPLIAKVCFFLFSVWQGWQHLPHYLDLIFAWLKSQILASVTVDEFDSDLRRDIQTYALECAVLHSSKHVFAQSATYARNTRKEPVPSGSTVVFECKSRIQFFRREKKMFMLTQESDGTIKIWTLARNADAIKDMLAEIHAAGEDKRLSKEIKVFCAERNDIHYGGDKVQWKRQPRTERRTMESVCLPSKIKTKLTMNIERFLHSDAPAWYAAQGQPHRQGYLLYGPPGCGKTSFAKAVATDYKLNIYSLSLANRLIDDQILLRLLKSVEPRCLILMDDIDYSGIDEYEIDDISVDSDRAQVGKYSGTNLVDEYESKLSDNDHAWFAEVDSDEAELKGHRKGEREKDEVKLPAKSKRLTRNGLLNAIDGTCSPTGHILIITTNFPERLDPALLRPGRIDFKVELTFANHEQIRAIFMKTMKPFFPEKLREYSEEDMSKLADQFAKQVPEGRLSPAQIQQYCTEHIDNPNEAVRGVVEWIEQDDAESQKIATYGEKSKHWALHSKEEAHPSEGR